MTVPTSKPPNPPLIRMESVVVTPEEAKELLKFNTFEYQRRLDPAHVQFLANEMRAGRFKPLQPIEFAELDGRPVLFNGQNCLHAVLDCRLPQYFQLRYHAECTLEQLRLLYSTTDIGQRRTMMQCLKAMGLHTELGRTLKQISWANNSMRVLLAGFNGKLRGEMAVWTAAEGIREYADGLNLFCQAIVGCPREMVAPLTRAATVAVALAACQDAPAQIGVERVLEFWQGTAIDDGLRVGDPRKTLNKDLLNTSPRDVVTPVYMNRRVSIDEAVWRIVRCWDAWVKDESIIYIKRPSVLPAVRIARTRFDGSQQPSPTQAESNGQVRSKEKGGRN